MQQRGTAAAAPGTHPGSAGKELGFVEGPKGRRCGRLPVGPVTLAHGKSVSTGFGQR
ncbi:hypothetical protein [Streptomyces rimosus]|uniref:hypothetical protein n=1 Tax=Streptomyces rimosus TaxID=1927 RepID=UPI00131E6907|nr:hypothetical protein [Streptomyces rimosus]